ncbi:MAG: nuclease, partial [Acinetobacter sp.]
MDIQTKKFAVLIDADNSSIHAISSILEEVAKYGI